MSEHCAFVLGGGGARTAYQAGVLWYLGEAFPDTVFPSVVASGMGALTAGALTSTAESWAAATRQPAALWRTLGANRVFEPRSLWALVRQLVQYAPSRRQSLLDPDPLRSCLAEIVAVDDEDTLTGIRENVGAGWLRTLAVTTSHYGTLETVTWTQGRPMEGWKEAARSSRPTDLTLDHLIASTALPLLYPAVSIRGEWHGAGVGMLHPLSPALRLGASRILAVSSRAEASSGEDTPEESYPAPLQVASILSNTLLLDTLEADAASLDRIDDLARKLPADEREGMSPADVLVLRPSVDLRALADDLDVNVTATLGPVVQYLHDVGADLPDVLSLLLFDPAYIRRLVLLGYEDTRERHARIEPFLQE